MQSINNPTHLDSGRIAVPAGLLTGLFVYFLTVWFVGQFLAIFVSLLAFAAVAGWLYRTLNHRRAAQEAAAQEGNRQNREADTLQKLAEARRKGDFDRWTKK